MFRVIPDKKSYDTINVGIQFFAQTSCVINLNFASSVVVWKLLPGLFLLKFRLLFEIITRQSTIFGMEHQQDCLLTWTM